MGREVSKCFENIGGEKKPVSAARFVYKCFTFQIQKETKFSQNE